MTSIALTTGATGGIGRALALQMRAQSFQVAAVGRDSARLALVDDDLHIAADTTTPEGAAPALLAHCVGNTLIAPLRRTRLGACREQMRRRDGLVARGWRLAHHRPGDRGGRRFHHRAPAGQAAAVT